LTTQPLSPGVYWVTSDTIDGDDPQEGPLFVSSVGITPAEDLLQYFQASRGFANLGSQAPNDAGANELRDLPENPGPRAAISGDHYAFTGGDEGLGIPPTDAIHATNQTDLCVTMAIRALNMSEIDENIVLFEDGGAPGGVSLTLRQGLIYGAAWDSNSQSDHWWASAPFDRVGSDAIVSMQHSLQGSGGITLRINGQIVAGPLGNDTANAPGAIGANEPELAFGHIHRRTRYPKGNPLGLGVEFHPNNVRLQGRIYAAALYRVDPGDALAVDVGQADQADGYQSAISAVERFVAEQTGLTGLLGGGVGRRPSRRRRRA